MMDHPRDQARETAQESNATPRGIPHRAVPCSAIDSAHPCHRDLQIAGSAVCTKQRDGDPHSLAAKVVGEEESYVTAYIRTMRALDNEKES